MKHYDQNYTFISSFLECHVPCASSFCLLTDLVLRVHNYLARLHTNVTLKGVISLNFPSASYWTDM